MIAKFQEKILKSLEAVVHSYSIDKMFWKFKKIPRNWDEQ